MKKTSLALVLGGLALVLAATGPEVPPEWAELVPNARVPREGVLSGGQPSPEQLEAIQEAGFRTVINLRAPGEPHTAEEPELVDRLGLDYLSIPVRGAAGMTEENARALAKALEESEGPVLLHCSSGNRIGGLFALMAFYVDGKGVEEAIEIGLASGMTRLEPAVRQHLRTADQDR